MHTFVFNLIPMGHVPRDVLSGLDSSDAGNLLPAVKNRAAREGNAEGV